MSSSLKDAFVAALHRAAEQQTQQTQPTIPSIPNDWDDEGGAKQIEAVSTQQPKENVMGQQPTLTPTGKHLFQTTNNISRVTFEFVRDNPGLTRMEAMDELERRGYPKSSTGSLLSNMVRQRLIVRTAESKLYPAQKEYTPLKTSKAFRMLAQAGKTKRKQVKMVVRKKQEDATPVEASTPTLTEKKAAIPRGDAYAGPRVEPVVGEWSVEGALKGLSVLQAKALYDELKKLFA